MKLQTHKSFNSQLCYLCNYIAHRAQCFEAVVTCFEGSSMSHCHYHQTHKNCNKCIVLLYSTNIIGLNWNDQGKNEQLWCNILILYITHRNNDNMTQSVTHLRCQKSCFLKLCKFNTFVCQHLQNFTYKQQNTSVTLLCINVQPCSDSQMGFTMNWHVAFSSE